MCGYFGIEFIDFILTGKILIYYASLFLFYDFEKMTISSWVNLRMNKCISIECNCIEATNIYSNLSHQTTLRLNEIDKN